MKLIAYLFVIAPVAAALSIAGGLVAVAAVGMVIRRATRQAKEETVPPEVAPA